MNKVHDYDLVRLRVRLSERNALGKPRALLIRNLGACTDRELAAVAGRFQRPVTIRHPRFGRLTLDRAFDTFEGRGKWGGRSVRVRLTSTGETVDRSLKWAERLFANQRRWQPCIQKEILADLYDTWMQSWRLEGQKLLGKKEFLAKMRPTTVNFDRSGAFSVWHDDGDLFGGHAVVARGKVTGGIRSVDLEG
jgi:hypothetical protein